MIFLTERDILTKTEFIRNTWDWEPHKGQREFLEYVSKVKVAACGRRWGKTEACAYDIAYYFLNRENFTQMIVSPTYDQSRLIFTAVESLLYGQVKAEVRKTPYPMIKYRNNIISARTADNDGRGLRGFKADRIIVDEAAFVGDRVIYEVICPMLADRNGDLVLISTPFGKNHFYDFYMKGAERNSEFASFSYKSADNPHISREYIEKQRENISQLSFETEYEAKFCDNVSNVFRRDTIANAVKKEFAPFGKCVMGVDFARYSDYTAIAVLNTDGEWASLGDLVRFNKMTWSGEINIIMENVRKYRPAFIVCDATGVGDPLCENLEKQIMGENLPCSLIRFRFSSESKNLIVDYLNLLLETEKIALKDIPVLIKEMENFEYTYTESGNIKLEAKYSFHDDTVCALALACHGMKSLPKSANFFSF